MTTVCVFKDRIYADTLITFVNKEGVRETNTTRVTKIKMLPRPVTFESGNVIVGAIAAGALETYELYFAYLTETINLFESEAHLIQFFKPLHEINSLSKRSCNFIVFGYTPEGEVITYHPADDEFKVETFSLGSGGGTSLNRYVCTETLDLISDPLVEFGARVLLDNGSNTDYNLWDPKDPTKLTLCTLKGNKELHEKINKVIFNKIEVDRV